MSSMRGRWNPPPTEEPEEKFDTPMFICRSWDEADTTLKSGYWKLVSVTKGDGFPGDPEFLYWMVHRDYA